MRYVFFILGLGFIINYYTSQVNHSCETSERVGRAVIKECSQLEAKNSPNEQQTMFGRTIVK